MYNETHLKEVSEVLSIQGIKHSNKDASAIVFLANEYNRQGYKITPKEIAEFLNTIKNQKMIQERGLTKTIQAMRQMKMTSIINPNKHRRNDVCPNCDSGKKYKKCCLNKK